MMIMVIIVLIMIILIMIMIMIILIMIMTILIMIMIILIMMEVNQYEGVAKMLAHQPSFHLCSRLKGVKVE